MFALRQVLCLRPPRDIPGFETIESRPPIDVIGSGSGTKPIVCDLPAEIVLSIFELSLHGITSPLQWLRQVQNFRMVRRQWNEWIIGSPFFWTVVYMDRDFCPSPPPSHMAALKLAKLDLVLDIRSFTVPEPFGEPSSDLDRVEGIQVALSSYRSIPWRSLSVNFSDTHEMASRLVHSLQLLSGTSAIQLQTLRLTNTNINWPTHTLSNIETVELGARSSIFQVAPSELARLTLSSPRLTHLIIHKAEMMHHEPVARVRFPALRTVFVSFAHNAYRIIESVLSTLDAPELESLAVENVSLGNFVSAARGVRQGSAPLYPHLRALRIEAPSVARDNRLGSLLFLYADTVESLAPALHELVLVRCKTHAVAALLAHVTPPSHGAQWAVRVQWPELRVLALSSPESESWDDESRTAGVNSLLNLLVARRAAGAGVERVDAGGAWYDIVRPQVLSWCESNFVSCDGWRPGKYVQPHAYFDSFD